MANFLMFAGSARKTSTNKQLAAFAAGTAKATHAGEREVKKALRQTLFKYKLHQDAELFERAYGYIREYY